MGWFSQQLEQREEYDRQAFSQPFAAMRRTLLGQRARGAAGRLSGDAEADVLAWFGLPARRLPPQLTELRQRLDYQLAPAGILSRPIELSGAWYEDGGGLVLAWTREGAPLLLTPRSGRGFACFDREQGRLLRVDAKIAAGLRPQALCFYRPLPQRSLGAKDFAAFLRQSITLHDTLYLLALLLITAVVGLIPAQANAWIFSQVVEGDLGLLPSFLSLLVGATVALSLFNMCKSLISARIALKLTGDVQSALMMRLLALPSGFFRQYNAGELASRVQSAVRLTQLLTQISLTTLLTALFSLIYIGQIAAYAPALAFPSFVVLSSTLLCSGLALLLQTGHTRRVLSRQAKLTGLLYGLLGGIQKIRLAGAEKRAFGKWARLYTENVAERYDPPLFLKLSGVLSQALALLGMIWIYAAALQSRVSVADYMAFAVAYGMVQAAFISLAASAASAANIKPLWEMAAPLLAAVPDSGGDKKPLERLSGGLELNNIWFRYQADGPWVLRDLSLKLKPGEYVAIVGTTGCGKSTLLRLLLGFETPERGAVYYDGKDLQTLELRALRRQIGVVLQNGSLFPGSILSNITISAPWLGQAQAWAAAEQAGLAEDIRRMPMGMQTMIAEGGGGISGGQRQRLMIARAIAAQPRLLMFDEATSALDNISQKIVSDSLDQLQCTRLVIAHRLSTIRRCDRILVLDQGHIAESGSYEQLLALGGLFAGLVERQRMEGQ